MKSGLLQSLKTFPALLTAPRPQPLRQAELIVSVQRRIVLPVKAGVLAVVLYFVFSSEWNNGVANMQMVFLGMLKWFYVLYIFCNVVAGAIFFSWKRFPAEFFQWLVFVLGLLDGLFVAGLMLIPGTGGWQSVAFWLFPILIVLNAISIPLAIPQIALNLALSAFFIGVGILYANIGQGQIAPKYMPGLGPLRPAQTNAVAGGSHPAAPERSRKPIQWDSSMPPVEEPPAESFMLRLSMLLLLTLCCYGVQALAERRRRELEDAREFAMREGQLHSAGRLAAEFAHQIKNPLAVIANAAYSLERSLRENKNSAAQQIEIIREEVAHADRVITQIMGYAQLSEGRVEKLDVLEELESAIARVFPPAVPTEIKIHRRYAGYLPPLLMQRTHLSEIFVNLLKNAREATGQAGNIFIVAEWRSDKPVQISIRDDGQGIAPDKITRIFEAYYTTKSGGSGLGLAIVKHNTELYGGHVQVKSEAGKGAEFILTFPPKAIMNVRK